MRRRFFALFTVVIILTTFLVMPVLGQPQLLTPPERNNFQSVGGTKYQPLMEFIQELGARSDLIHIQKLTETLSGRDVVLCILSNPPVYKPEDIAKSGKPVVLIVNNVHGGEYAGKDASLAIMRDLCLGDLRPLLDKVIVLNVPTINPDGAEIGNRTNIQQFDMNRDYIKLESQEIEALVTKVINTWHPDIHVDTHHGGTAPYVLVFQTCMNPAGDAELIKYGNEKILARVRAALRAEDFDGFWYSSPGSVGGVQGWVPTSVEPRKQHVYATLANMFGFLFETPGNTARVIKNGTEVVAVPANERYKNMVRGQYIGQRELIRFAADNAPEMKRVLAEAEQRAIRLGSNDSDNDQIPIKYKQVANFNENFWVVKRSTTPATPPTTPPTTPPAQRTQQQAAEYELVNRPIFNKFEPTKTVTRPWGYLIPPSLAKVIPLLLEHDITVLKITEPITAAVEAYSATNITHNEYFQGHYLKEVTAVVRVDTVRLPAGAFFVPAGQPKSNLLCYLLEPETDDNIITWGYLDDFLRVPTSRAETGDIPLGAGAPTTVPARRDTTVAAAGRGGMPGQGGGRGSAGQQVPIYRLMKKMNFKTVIVQPYNMYEKNRYIKW